MMGDFNAKMAGEETWLTPPEIIKPLGEFDLDPCSPIGRPWDTAKHHLTKEDDGLLQPWFGRVWMNPPYGRGIGQWIERLALHGDGIALTFNRSDTNAFYHYVFPFADSILYIKGRLRFLDINGNPGGSAPAPSVLIAFKDYNSDILESSGIRGRHIPNGPPLIVIGMSAGRTWRLIVGNVVREFNGGAELSDIYDRVIQMAPDRVRRNRHYKAKIRQTLQYFHHKKENKWI